MAVAASNPSITGMDLPARFASAMITPHRSATEKSMGRILWAKRAWRSTSSQVSNCVRRFPCGSPAVPFRSSPRVSTLRNRSDSSAASIQSSTCGSGLGRTNSEMQFVSRRNPLIIRRLGPCLFLVPDRVLRRPGAIRERTAQASWVAVSVWSGDDIPHPRSSRHRLSLDAGFSEGLGCERDERLR
jgi:hypothetical protein